MKDKEIRRLNKTELLWIIHDQEEEILELKEELNRLRSLLSEEEQGE